MQINVFTTPILSKFYPETLFCFSAQNVIDHFTLERAQKTSFNFNPEIMKAYEERN